LASVFATVREHLGAVTVDSVVGKGSTFALWLPAVEESPHAADPAATPRGRGHLLLVDDEPSLREVGAKLLHELGYTVDVAPDGVGAIAKIALGPDSYCAVLLDVMMPLMSGSDVYERIQALAPRLPVIIVSGYGAQAEMLLARGVAAVLPKPYTLSQLAQTLSRVLVGPTAPR
jgi:CheY-like chemotaxis protein